MSNDFKALNRQILSQFLPNHEAVKAFEKALSDVGETFPDAISALQTEVAESDYHAGVAFAAANQALSTLVLIAQSLAQAMLAPIAQPSIPSDDLSPPYDPAGSAASVQNILAAHIALTGTAVHGLGTVATLASDTDTALAANSDARVATQKATKTYVDNAVTGLMDFKGSTDCGGNPNYPAALKGDAYVVSVAGKIGGAAGLAVDIGDVYVASADNAGGTQAAVGTSWFILEHNLAGALLAANNLSDLANAATARSNLGVTATGADTTYAFRANNLSDLASAATARGNLGLGTMATQNANAVAITGGTVGTSTSVEPAVAIKPKSDPVATDWGEDFAARGTTTIANTATSDLTTGSGVVVLHINNTGEASIFLCWAGNTTKLGGSGNVVSGVPAAGQVGLYYNGGTGKYRIENQQGASRDIYITTIKTRTAS